MHQTARMTAIVLLAIGPVLVLSAERAAAADGFEKVRCDSDMPRALMGKKAGNEPVSNIEKRHVALGLKDLGGDEISDGLNTVSWSICGKEYVVLQDSGDVVRDVVAFPPHSKGAPEFVGGDCQLHGTRVAAIIMAVLQDKSALQGTSSGDALLPATTAWKIDEKRRMFVALPTAGLYCPRSGIVTADGGR
jgi:hypothetical protein